MAAAMPQVENVVGSTMASPGDMDRGEFLTMDYARLVAPLCAAVGELRRQVADLKQQLQSGDGESVFDTNRPQRVGTNRARAKKRL